MKKILLIDGHSILNRAFFGLPDLTNDKGLHTNAIYGFLNILFRIIEEENPTNLAVAFDVSAPTFRHQIYSAYKGTRKPMADELRQQVPVMKDVLKSMGIKIYEKAGLEADDILGTLAKKAEAEGFNVSLLSGDRDLLQIASEKIKIRIPKTKAGKTTITDYYAKDVLAEYQVTPVQFIEMKALMGDTSDNIPGAPSVGPKTAMELLVTYQTIDNIYANIENITKKALKKNLEENRDLVDLSKVLATINIDAEFDYNFDENILGNIYTEDAYKLFRELSFKNLLSRFDDNNKGNNEDVLNLISSFEIVKKNNAKSILEEASKCGSIGLVLYSDKKKDAHEEKSGQLSLFEVDSSDDFLAMSLSFAGKTYYLDSQNIDMDIITDGFGNIFNSKTIIFTHSVKKIYEVFELNDKVAREISKKFMDIELMEYLLNPLTSDPEYLDIAKKYLNMDFPLYDGKILKNEGAEKSKESDEKAFTDYVCEGAYISLTVAEILMSKLKENGMDHLFHDIEMPASYVLYAMEHEGMYVKKDELKAYSEMLSGSIEVLEKRIYEQAGHEFNINSPKQLGVVLFEEMGLVGGKKTKTGFSTSAEVLEKLASDCPVVKDILEYRTLAKLKSTYADGLVNYIGSDGRIHSNFNQTITATGRISSDNPNMQNIPTRMELGRKIRKVFVPKTGFKYVDADYSQIELRLLAAFSKDEQLVNAFNEGQDIHALTASKVFGVDIDKVDSNMRRSAKAVNFGIVYGISSFGLSQDLDISKAEAKKYIDEYFNSYPGISAYLEDCKERAKKDGYSETFLGRRRPIPELASSNFMTRQFGERVAMNAPLQGSAADIMKIAMINVYDRIIKEDLSSRLVLQVHDELIIETAPHEVDRVSSILKEEMEGAADLLVKLDVSSAVGDNWYEAK